MKTIAIDEVTAKLLDKLTERSRRHQSRSALLRAAVRQYAAQQKYDRTAISDEAIVRKHRRRLARDARALLAEQARS